MLGFLLLVMYTYVFVCVLTCIIIILNVNAKTDPFLAGTTCSRNNDEEGEEEA